jgi:ABC-type transport system involved in cytochrome c biogenesis ATPase subunit
MNFYKSRLGRSPVPPEDAEYPCVVVVDDNWDDYGHKTLFHLYYFDRAKRQTVLGDVKILQSEKSTTTLRFPFEDLPDDCVSLGQELSYYSTAKDLGTRGRSVLRSLNDVVLRPDLLDSVETKSGFRNSLVRSNEAKRALRYGLFALEGEARSKEYRFGYSGQIPGADGPVDVDFNLDAKDPVPGRIAAIIGRNGVGKTQFLARLAIDLATPIRLSKQSADQVEQAFTPRRPLFSRVIALSFSAFDKFLRPQKKNISYIYCGVRDDNGKLSRTALEAKHLDFLKRIEEQERSRIWEQHIAAILGVRARDVSFRRYVESLNDESEPSLSSGQSILTYFTSAALAYLKEDSLVLFDEPEIHLHPAAVAVLMQVLHSLLEEFDSYAILATHSPVVIQEVPGRRVIRFDRQANVTTASALPQESFGENISELTRIVFETVESPSFYKSVLKNLRQERSFEEVSSLFNDQLSLHAAAYLASLEPEGDV